MRLQNVDKCDLTPSVKRDKCAKPGVLHRADQPSGSSPKGPLGPPDQLVHQATAAHYIALSLKFLHASLRKVCLWSGLVCFS